MREVGNKSEMTRVTMQSTCSHVDSVAGGRCTTCRCALHGCGRHGCGRHAAAGGTAAGGTAAQRGRTGARRRVWPKLCGEEWTGCRRRMVVVSHGAVSRRDYHPLAAEERRSWARSSIRDVWVAAGWRGSVAARGTSPGTRPRSGVAPIVSHAHRFGSGPAEAGVNRGKCRYRVAAAAGAFQLRWNVRQPGHLPIASIRRQPEGQA